VRREQPNRDGGGDGLRVPRKLQLDTEQGMVERNQPRVGIESPGRI
jgi:hypothetical protein